MARSLQCTPKPLSLSLSDEPSHESRNLITSKQNCTRTTLLTAEEAQQQVAPQLWIPALANVCLLVQSAALAPGPPSSDSMRAALTIRRRSCYQATQ